MTLSILQNAIPRRCKTCKMCAKTFASGDSYYSALESGHRQDYCFLCWDQTNKAATDCFWKATIPLKEEIIAVAQTKLSLAIGLLKNNLEENPSEALLLALYLTRKRLLAFRKDFKEGNQVISLYEILATGEIIQVKKVPSHLLDSQAIQTSLASKLTNL